MRSGSPRRLTSRLIGLASRVRLPRPAQPARRVKRVPLVHLNVPADRVPLNLDQSILLSLIANELLLNSLKHAFHGRAGGKVDAELRATRDRVTLTIRDDGNGFVLRPTEIEDQHGTGIDLVQAMSRQLGGEFVVKRMPAGGTCTTISFPSKMSRQQPSVHL